jgi:predicted unusual protein kinase regulating ubiquinone biosynthesis (AarF/ABC1/UbiB family)
VYKAVLRDTGEEVAVKVQRPGIEPLILRDLYVFRALGSLFNAFSQQRLGCNAELVVDEFGEKLLEELDYMQVGCMHTACVGVWASLWVCCCGGLLRILYAIH